MVTDLIPLSPLLRRRAVPPVTPDLTPAPSYHAPLDTSLLSPLPPTTPGSFSTPSLPPIPAPLTPLLSPNPAFSSAATSSSSSSSSTHLVHIELVAPPPSSKPATFTAHSSQSSSKSTQTLVHTPSSSSNPKGKTSASSSFANLLDAALLSPVAGLGLGLNLDLNSGLASPKQRLSSPALMEAEETHVGEDPAVIKTKDACDLEPAPAAVAAAAAKIIVTSPKVGKTHGAHGGGFKKMVTSFARW